MIARISSIFQFLLGFILGIVLIAGTTAVVGFYYISRMSVAPPKPVFAEEKSAPKSETKAETKTKTEQDNPPEPTQATAEPETIPEPEEKPEEELPTNAYKARVTWPQGLSLRESPDSNGARIGGVEHNAEIIILEESQDKKWQRVRLPWSEQEGWVKAGNVERVY
jgi:hypothetical protein